MKWVGVFLMAGAVGLGGCLIPQDDTLFAGLPPPRNRPPRIVENQVSPQTRIIREFGSDTCREEFEVLVIDPDVEDKVVVNWFVDYTPGQGNIDFSVELAPTTVPQRNDRATFVVDLTAANSPLSAPGLHTVEAVVSDRTLVASTRLTVPITEPNPDGGAPVVVDEGYVVTYAWTVETVPGVCP
jgi:hypothetical protein